MNIEFINGFLQSFIDGEYVINNDNSVSVQGDVDISKIGLHSIPFNFREVSGDFNCSRNNLTSLDWSPKTVGGSFYCSNNQLTTLEGAPNKVGADFLCNHNNLTSLKGCPRSVGGSFFCYSNNITSLAGVPNEIGGNFNFDFTPIETSIKNLSVTIFPNYSNDSEIKWDELNYKIKLTKLSNPYDTGRVKILAYNENKLIAEMWCNWDIQNNSFSFHKTVGPAMKIYYPNGKIKMAVWGKNGFISNNRHAARIEWNISGNVMKIEYITNGKHHLAKNAAIIIYDDNGLKLKEEYYKFGINTKTITYKDGIPIDKKHHLSLERI